MIEKTLVLSTAHVPNYSKIYFGDIRNTTHDYGWVVFVCPDIEKCKVPGWLRDIHEYALYNECSFIVFDVDAAVHPEFKTC